METKKKRQMRSRRRSRSRASRRRRASRKSRGGHGTAWSTRLCNVIKRYADQADQLHSKLQECHKSKTPVTPVMLIGLNNIEEKIWDKAPVQKEVLRTHLTKRLEKEAQKIIKAFPFKPHNCVVFFNGDPKRMLHRNIPGGKLDVALHPWMFVIDALIKGGYTVVSGSTSAQKTSTDDLFVQNGSPIPHIKHGPALDPNNTYLAFDHVIYPNVQYIFRHRKKLEPTSTLSKTLTGLREALYTEERSIPDTDDGKSNPPKDSTDPNDYFVLEDQQAYFDYYVSIEAAAAAATTDAAVANAIEATT